MARKQNLQIDQGAEFQIEFDLHDELGDPLDITGYTATAAMKPWYTYGNTYSFTTTLVTGKLILTMDTTATSVIPAGRYVYTADMTYIDGSTMRVVEGNVDVHPKV
jgi:hypothetical protein